MADTLSYNGKNIAEFRANGGTVEQFGDAPLLLLTTTGAKSGRPRTNPMMYLADAANPDRVYVFASYAGKDVDPAWFHNLVAHPDVTVEIGTDTVTGAARPLTEPARTEIYTEQARRYPGFADYEDKTERTIPVVAIDLVR